MRGKERNGGEGLEWGWRGTVSVPVEGAHKGPNEILVWKGCYSSFPKTEILCLVSPMFFFFSLFLNSTCLLKFSPKYGDHIGETPGTVNGYITEARIMSCPSLLLFSLWAGLNSFSIFPLYVKDIKCPGTKLPRLSSSYDTLIIRKAVRSSWIQL